MARCAQNLDMLPRSKPADGRQGRQALHIHQPPSLMNTDYQEGAASSPRRGQESGLKQGLKSLEGDPISNHIGMRLNESPLDKAVADCLSEYKRQVFFAPVNVLRNFSPSFGFLKMEDAEELEHCLMTLVCFLRIHQLRLAEPCFEGGISPADLAHLADEAGELKRVARKALTYLQSMRESVHAMTEPREESAPESVQQGNNNRGDDGHENPVDNTTPINTGGHAEL